MSEPFTIDLDALVDGLTIAEAAEIEAIAGEPIASVIGADMTAKALLAVAFVMKRRSDPTYTLARAGSLRWVDITLSGANDGE